MAETTRTRVRRRLRRRGRDARGPAVASPLTWSRGPDEPPGEPEDLDGGAGVREPRRPYPTAPAGALALDEPRDERLDLVG